MRAVLRSASKQKPLCNAVVRRKRSFGQPNFFGNHHNASKTISFRHFSSPVLDDFNEESDADNAGGDDIDQNTTTIDQDEIRFFMTKLNMGVQSGLITSQAILDSLDDLIENGIIVPTIILFDAVELLAKRREPHYVEILLRIVKEKSKSFGISPEGSLAKKAGSRTNSSAYEVDKLAAFGIKKILRHSTGDALTLWNNVTEEGYMATKADLTDMLREISDTEHLPDIAFTLKITGIMQQNAWNNSSEYYQALLSVYHSYLNRKNRDSLPALITVCNYFERAFHEYERRITDTKRGMHCTNAILEGKGFKTASYSGQKGRTPGQLCVLDEEIHALRASFWATAYEVSAGLRHVQKAEGRPSGEKIYNMCGRKAVDLHSAYYHPDAAPGPENGSSGGKKEDGSRFKLLASLLGDLQRDLSGQRYGPSPPQGDTFGPSHQLPFPLERLSQLQHLRESKRFAPNSAVGVSFGHVELDDEQPLPPKIKRPPRLTKYSLGRSQVVPKVRSEFDRSDAEGKWQEDDEDEVVEERGTELSAHDEVFVIEDFDHFGNNGRVTDRKGLSDQGRLDNIREVQERVENKAREQAGSGSVSGSESPSDLNDFDSIGNSNPDYSTTSSRSGAVKALKDKASDTGTAALSSERRTENLMRESLQRLVFRLADSCYEAESEEELILRLTEFLACSRKSSTYSREENNMYLQEVMGGIMKAARFSPPLRAVYLYRPHGPNSLQHEPEFYQQHLPALCEAGAGGQGGMTAAEYEQRQCQREREGLLAGELDELNRFCNVGRQRNHIERIDALSERLRKWGQEREVPTGAVFAAAWIGAYLRPYPSEVAFDRMMDRPLADYDWRISFAAAKKTWDSLSENDVNTPEAYHSLVSILCEHENIHREALQCAFAIVTEEMKKKRIIPLPETMTAITRSATMMLPRLDLASFVKHVESYAGLVYEGRRGAPKRKVGKKQSDDPALLRALLDANCRLDHGYESLFLLHTLRAIGARIELLQILNVGKAICYSDVKNSGQLSVNAMVAFEDSDPGQICDFILQEVRRSGYATDHLVINNCMLLHRRKVRGMARVDRLHKLKARIYAERHDLHFDYFDQKFKSYTQQEASLRLLDFAGNNFDMEGTTTDPREKAAKRWTLRHIIVSHLCVQHMKQAHDLLTAITEVHSLAPSSRFYDPFTHYYAIRGRTDRFEEIVQRMVNAGVKPSNIIAEHALTCYIVASHKGFVEVDVPYDKVQELYNAHRVRPSPTGLIRLIDWLLFVGEEVEARRAVGLIGQIYSERERETEYHWPSHYTVHEFNRGEVNKPYYAAVFAAQRYVYNNGRCRGDPAVLSIKSLEKRFEAAGFSLTPTATP